MNIFSGLAEYSEAEISAGLEVKIMLLSSQVVWILLSVAENHVLMIFWGMSNWKWYVGRQIARWPHVFVLETCLCGIEEYFQNIRVMNVISFPHLAWINEREQFFPPSILQLR